MFAQSHRVQNACRAESAVEEVNTAVNKLHAEVQSLKALKAALLKHTTTAAKAAALVAKQQQAAESAKANSCSSRKRKAAAYLSDSDPDDHSISEGDGTDNDAAEGDAAGSGNASAQHSIRSLQDVCGPAWRLFQSMTLCSTSATPACKSATLQISAGGKAAAVQAAGLLSSSPADVAADVGVPDTNSSHGTAGQTQPAAASRPGPSTAQGTAAAAATTPAQYDGSRFSSVDPAVSLQRLQQSCMQQVKGASSSSYTNTNTTAEPASFDSILRALQRDDSYDTAPWQHDSNSSAPSQQQQLACLDLDGLVLADQAAAGASAQGLTSVLQGQGATSNTPTTGHAATDGTAAPAAAAAAESPAPVQATFTPFSVAALLQEFDLMHAPSSSSQQQHRTGTDAEMSLICNRFMLLSTAAADPLCTAGLVHGTTLSQGTAGQAAGPWSSQQQQQQAEPGLPSYMQQVIKQPALRPATGCGRAEAAVAGDGDVGPAEDLSAAVARATLQADPVLAGVACPPPAAAAAAASHGSPGARQLPAQASLQEQQLQPEAHSTNSQDLLGLESGIGVANLQPLVHQGQADASQQQQEVEQPSSMQHAQLPCYAAATQNKAAAASAAAVQGQLLQQQLQQFVGCGADDDSDTGLELLHGEGLQVCGLDDGGQLGDDGDQFGSAGASIHQQQQQQEQHSLAEGSLGSSGGQVSPAAATTCSSPSDLLAATAAADRAEVAAGSEGFDGFPGLNLEEVEVVAGSPDIAATYTAAAAAEDAHAADDKGNTGAATADDPVSVLHMSAAAGLCSSVDSGGGMSAKQQQQRQQTLEQPSGQAQQQQQQQVTDKARSTYVPRFTKRKQNYHLLVDSLQQQQQPGTSPDTAAPAAANDVIMADGVEADLCLIEHADADEPAGGLHHTLGGHTSHTVPRMTTKRLSVSLTAAAAGAAPGEHSQHMEAAGNAEEETLEGDAVSGALAGGSSVRKVVLPLLRRRAGGKQGSSSQLHTAGTASQAGAEGSKGNCSTDDGMEDDIMKDDVMEDDIIEDVSDAEPGEQLQQDGPGGAVQGTGYRGTVPSLGRWKAPAVPASQAPPGSHNSQGNASSSSHSQHSSSQCTSSSWGASSDSESDKEGPENANSSGARSGGSSLASGAAPQGQSRQLKAPSQSQPVPAAAAGSRWTVTAAAAAVRAASAARIPPGQQPEQQHLLLQQSFRPATAWQYSSSNLLRLSQGWGKRRVKPVVNPEALLKRPAVSLKQLSLSHAVSSAGLVQVSQLGTAASVLKALMGEDHFQQHFCHTVQQQQQQQQQQPMWHGQQQQQMQQQQHQHPPWPGQQQQQQWPSVLPNNAGTTLQPAAAAATPQDADDDFDDFDWAAVDELEAQHVAAAPAGPVPGSTAAGVASAGVIPSAANAGGGGVAAAAAGCDDGRCGGDSLITTALADLQRKQQQPGPAWQQQQQGAAWQQQQQPQATVWQQQQTTYPESAPHHHVPWIHPPQQPQEWKHQQEQQRQQQALQPQDPIATALAGLLGLSDDEDEAPTAAAEGQPMQQQGHTFNRSLAVNPAQSPATAVTAARGPQDPASVNPVQQQQPEEQLVITGLVDCVVQQQPQLQPQQPWSVWGAPESHSAHGPAAAWSARPTPQQQQVHSWAALAPHPQQQQQQRQSQGPTGQAMSQLPEVDDWDDEELNCLDLDTAMDASHGMQGLHMATAGVAATGDALYGEHGQFAGYEQQQQQWPLFPGPAAATAAATAAAAAGFSVTPGQPQYSASQVFPPSSQAGPTQLQQLQDELEDLACQLVFLDEVEAVEAAAAAGNGAAAAAADMCTSAGHAAGIAMKLANTDTAEAAAAAAALAGNTGMGGTSGWVSQHTDCTQRSSHLATWHEGIMPASTPGAAGDSLYGHSQYNCSMALDSLFDDETAGQGCVLIDDPEMQQEAGMEAVEGDAGFGEPAGAGYTLGAGAEAEEMGPDNEVSAVTNADQPAVSSYDCPQRTDASGVQSASQHGAAGEPGPSTAQHSMLGRVHAGQLRFGGIGSRLALGRTTALAHMGPAERAAWAAIAKQRQQQLYGRFIELALQGQHAAAVQGHCGLNQLMELVRSCIQEEVQGSSQAGGSNAGGSSGSGSGSNADGSNADGSNGGNRVLNVMALIKKVQLRHQQMLLQKQQGNQTQGLTQPAGDVCLQPPAGKAAVAAAAGNSDRATVSGRSGVPAAAAVPAGDGLGVVAQQRLFVAFLNVAHQNNLAAAAADATGAATGGASVTPAGQVPVSDVDGGGAPCYHKATHNIHTGKKRTHTGQVVACGSTAGGEQQLGNHHHQQQQQQGLLSGWALGTKIFLT